MSMSLQRNRMHAVVDEMGHHLEARLGRRIFKIDTLLADPFHAARVFAGGVDETRRAALEVQTQRFSSRRGGGAPPRRRPRDARSRPPPPPPRPPPPPPPP